MRAVSNFLVKIDCFCDYVPFVSSVTNLIDLFQKCVILLLMDKSKIASSHYYKHLDQKSFSRCIVLVIPVIGNIIIGIYDFSNKKESNVDHHDKVDQYTKVNIGNHKIDGTRVSLDDVEKIVVGFSCKETWPCQHPSTVFLKDGRKVSGLNGYDICSIVSKIAQDRINPGQGWSADLVKEHFRVYSKSRLEMGWIAESPETVLNKIFSQR
jgi:hypothetical protein